MQSCGSCLHQAEPGGMERICEEVRASSAYATYGMDALASEALLQRHALLGGAR